MGVTKQAARKRFVPKDPGEPSHLDPSQGFGRFPGATEAIVRLHRDGRELWFEVADDGHGFDPDAEGYGTGMQGMVDRLAALGGMLRVESAPGAGTTVIGRIPVAP